ncbi:AraC family transcriptional regulator [Leptothoe sp. LEGE 181152]|nr:AraC family transcriptional regulator [Leptothoe sp. LEGE 181152]
MALELTDIDLHDLMVEANEQGEPIYKPTDLGYQLNMPQQIGQGDSCIVKLRGGLILETRNIHFHQSLALNKRHEHRFPIVANFHLSGGSRVKTPHVPGVKADYEELAGHSYLYHLPDLTETEEWPSDRPIQMVTISACVEYFRGFSVTGDALPRPLAHIMRDTNRFHQSLGKITPAMAQVLQQIIHCPYQGSAQHLYLESKALELLAQQFACLEEDVPAPKSRELKASDLERVQYAREILVKRLCDPLSLTDLARQAGLNECTLKRGFRQLFGTTVFGYLRNCRMQQAQTLLQSPYMTIAQVARQVGYRNPEAFSTAFRRQFAINPKAYQLQHRR